MTEKGIVATDLTSLIVEVLLYLIFHNENEGYSDTFPGSLFNYYMNYIIAFTKVTRKGQCKRSLPHK